MTGYNPTIPPPMPPRPKDTERKTELLERDALIFRESNHPQMERLLASIAISVKRIADLLVTIEGKK